MEAIQANHAWHLTGFSKSTVVQNLSDSLCRMSILVISAQEANLMILLGFSFVRKLQSREIEYSGKETQRKL